MPAADKSTEVRPVSVGQPSILIPTLVGLAIIAGGVFLIQDACVQLLDAIRVRAAIVGRLALGVVLLAGGVATLSLYVPTAKLKENVNRLHPLRGRSRAQIVNVLGRPKDVVDGPERKRTRLTWRTLLYRVTAEFRSDKCVGVTYHSD